MMSNDRPIRPAAQEAVRRIRISCLDEFDDDADVSAASKDVPLAVLAGNEVASTGGDEAEELEEEQTSAAKKA